MTLLSLLIAMALERVLLPSERWQYSTYFSPYLALVNRFELSQSWLRHGWGLLLIAAIPTALTFLLLQWVEGALFGFVSLAITVLLVLLAMGCLAARKEYKTFLRAACRGDEEACYLVAQRLDGSKCGCSLQENEQGDSLEQIEEGVGQALTWVNYRYYLAVMIWLMIFGVIGVVFYASLRTLADRTYKESEEEGEALVISDSIARILNWLDYIPVRIASLGLTLVGNFSKAMPVWLENLLNPTDSAKLHLIKVSLAAEEFSEPANPTCVESVTKFVEMAKRNVLLMLSLIAILTLYGSVS